MEPAEIRHPTVMDPTDLSLGELYAQALLESVPDDVQAEQVAQELGELLGVIESAPGAQNLLAGWAISAEKRTSLIGRLFAGRVSPQVESLLGVMNRRNRMHVLPAVVRAFRKLLDRREGKIEVTLTTAAALEPAQQEAIEQELSASLKQKAVVRVRVDEGLLGGAVLRIGDRVYDASIRARLRKIREMMAARRGELKMRE